MLQFAKRLLFASPSAFSMTPLFLGTTISQREICFRPSDSFSPRKPFFCPPRFEKTCVQPPSHGPSSLRPGRTRPGQKPNAGTMTEARSLEWSSMAASQRGDQR